jgi:hydroxyethylthiazole kinase
MRIIELLRSKSPLIHHITNFVTMNDCANATLAVGGSPVMVSSAEEAPQMAALASALVLNMGTSDDANLAAMLAAGRVAKDRGIPVVFDPVGAGATAFRQRVSLRVMEEIRPDIVKGNAAELSFLGGLKSAQRGVDSLQTAKAEAMFAVASRFGCVAVATGEDDCVCDGAELWAVRGGNPTLGRVCGTGCMGASVIASLAAVSGGAYLHASLSGCLAMKLAGEEAERIAQAARPGGAPGLSTFRWALMDALGWLDDAALDAARKAKCEAMHVRA